MTIREFGRMVEELKLGSQPLSIRLGAQQKLQNLNQSLASVKHETLHKFRMDKSVFIKGKKVYSNNGFNQNQRAMELEDELKKAKNMNTILMREIAKMKDNRSKKRAEMDKTLQKIKQNVNTFGQELSTNQRKINESMNLGMENPTNNILPNLDSPHKKEGDSISQYFNDKESSPVLKIATTGQEKTKVKFEEVMRENKLTDKEIEKVHINELESELESIKKQNQELDNEIMILRQRYGLIDKEKTKIREMNKKLEDDVRLGSLKLLELEENYTKTHKEKESLQEFCLNYREIIEKSISQDSTANPNNPFKSERRSSDDSVSQLSNNNKLKLLNLENTTLIKRTESLKKEVDMFRNEINMLRNSKGFDYSDLAKKIVVLDSELLGIKKYNEDILLELDETKLK